MVDCHKLKIVSDNEFSAKKNHFDNWTDVTCDVAKELLLSTTI